MKRRDRGAAMVEYMVLMAMLSVAVSPVLLYVGNQVSHTIQFSRLFCSTDSNEGGNDLQQEGECRGDRMNNGRGHNEPFIP